MSAPANDVGAKDKLAKRTMRALVVLPEDVILVGADGEGETPRAKIDWLKARHPDQSAQIEALVDERAWIDLDPAWVATCAGGIKKPVLGVLLGADPETGREVVAIEDGRCRTRAARIYQAKRKADDELPMHLVLMVRAGADARSIKRVAAMTSNFVPLSAVQRATRAQDLINDGADIGDVAQLFCLTVQGMKDCLALNAAPEAVREKVESGAITQSAAVSIVRAGVPAAEQEKRADTIVSTGATGSRARAIAERGDAAAGPKLHAPPRARVEVFLDALETSKPKDTKAHDAVKGAAAALRWARGEATALDRMPALKAVLEAEDAKRASKERKAKAETMAGPKKKRTTAEKKAA